MRSGWFWNTANWQQYLLEYAKTRPECLNEWKSSPLADDHDLSDAVNREGERAKGYIVKLCASQVIDLQKHQWSHIRKSYRGLINQAKPCYVLTESTDLIHFKVVHRATFGMVRNDETFSIQQKWADCGFAFSVLARTHLHANDYIAAALWIIYQGNAYLASDPSLERDVMHLVIWKSLDVLRLRGVRLVEMGQVDGSNDKEKGIGFFKSGFGGSPVHFTIVRRVP